ncbi:MAG: FtsK/SpoIIIE domain-containing protein [Verrucomicrobiia bacterium]
MNKHLGVNETLALLDRVNRVLSDFAGREEKLGNELRTRIGAENKAHEAAAGNQSAEVAELIAGAEAGCETEKKNRQANFEKRKARISQALVTTSRQVMEGTDRSGRRQRGLQRRAQDAERNRDAELTSIAAKREDFITKLAERGAAFAPLETAVSHSFRGYGAFRRLLSPHQSSPDDALPADENQLFEELQRLETKTREELERFEKIPLPRLFKFLPFWLLTILLLGSAVLAFGLSLPLLPHPGFYSGPLTTLGGILVALWVALLVMHQLGKRQGAPVANTIAGHLARARRLHDGSREQAEWQYTHEQDRIQNEFEAISRSVNQEWKQTQKEALETRGTRAQKVDEKGAHALLTNDLVHRAKLKQIENRHADNVARLRQEADARAKELDHAHAEKMVRLESEQQTRWQALEKEWKSSIQPLHEAITAANAAAAELFPDWLSPAWKNWTPPPEFKNVAKFGRMDVDVAKLAAATPKDQRLALPFPASFSVPLLLKYPGQGSILLETAKRGGDEAIGAINNIIFRLLSAHPPGKLSFTIFDPVGLGQNFAGLMHLADYEESHINSRIWTQSGQLEEKLAELNEHMEKVIQMYLRNEYETIAEYNAQAGTIAEKYHLLVIADFPVNFSDNAARRLINIATSGARCGVFTLIHWDQRHALPTGFVADELRKNSICLTRTDTAFRLENHQPPGTRLVLDVPPPPEFVTDFLHRVGESGKDSNRVEVPFEQVAPPPDKMWTEETTEELTVSIGRSGATKLQRLAIGKGTRQHALVAGKTGSGKSTLFHVMITNLALWCSPEQVEFYLVDFKKGVEFKCYGNRRLPHAKVVAIESDREFGLSVLQRVDEELRRRGDLFRKLSVQDVAGYKRAGGTEPMPRSLLIIDEFQEFFVEEDRVSQSAAVLLDRIVRQGRAFGIHVLLGSQTLGGAYTLARATIGQMVIRIALMCNEADAYLIMDQDNPAPRLLTRPGEGIYNDTAGSLEGNSPFQTVWLPEEVRDGFLAKVRARADQSQKEYPGPFVFEGNAAADVKENLLLQALLAAPSLGRADRPAGQETRQNVPAEPKVPVAARIWLGAPNSIKGPTEAIFQRQSGSNLLIVGQSEERAATLLAIALVSLAAQYPKISARFILLDSSPPGFPQRELLQRVIQAVPHEVVQVNHSNLAEVMGGLAADLKRSDETSDARDTFVLIQGLQNYKKLRQEDEFSFSGSEAGSAVSPAAALMSLISEGPAAGFHVIATCDTYNNVGRFLGRKTLTEFEMRVLFQMSASDSASLIDAPDASTLGLNRALYYNDREGYIETFRPYALPGHDWVEEAAQQLKRLLA